MGLGDPDGGSRGHPTMGLTDPDGGSRRLHTMGLADPDGGSRGPPTMSLAVSDVYNNSISLQQNLIFFMTATHMNK